MKNSQQSFEQRVTEIFDRSNLPAHEIILDDLDMRNLLKISRRTAYCYRKNGFLPFHRFNNGKVFYIFSEVLKAIKNASNNIKGLE